MGWYASYTGSFKFKVIEHVSEHGNRAAGQHFSVSVHAHYWQKQEDELRATKSKFRTFRGPTQGKFPLAENEVLECLCQEAPE